MTKIEDIWLKILTEMERLNGCEIDNGNKIGVRLTSTGIENWWVMCGGHAYRWVATVELRI
jgi:hypothetical protein